MTVRVRVIASKPFGDQSPIGHLIGKIYKAIPINKDGRKGRVIESYQVEDESFNGTIQLNPDEVELLSK